MNFSKEFIAQHLFLNEHQGIQEFVQHFQKNSLLCQNSAFESNQTWTVICERTEDIVPVRQQVLDQLELNLGKTIDIIGGISFLSADQFVQQLCASLSLSNAVNIKKKSPKFLSKPYIEIAKQEKIVEFILNLFHITIEGNILAKQILAVIDIPLPPHISIFDAFMDALQLKKKHSCKEIPEIFLKQILASVQACKIVLNRYARLQNFVWDFLHDMQTEFVKGPQSHFIMPKVLLGSFLWISAPEYASGLNAKNFKPGNFLDILMDDFLSILLKIWAQYPNSNGIFIHQRTILDSKKVELKKNSIDIHYLPERYAFYQKALAHKNENKTIGLMAEFDPRMFQTVRYDAGGLYKLLKKDLHAWKQKENNTLPPEISKQIDEKHDDFLDTASYVDNFTKIAEIAKIYSIPIHQMTDETIEEMFCSIISTELFCYKEEDTFHLSKPYLFISTQRFPEKVLVFWDKEHFERTSFSIRLFNLLFATFQSYGIDVDNPSSEKQFIYFWRYIAGMQSAVPEVKLQFVVESPAVLEKFPVNLKHQNYLNISNEMFKSVSFHNKAFEAELNYRWLSSVFQKLDYSQISTTQFDLYVTCPFQFFLKYGLNLNPDEQENAFAVDPLLLGTKVHKICDIILSGMVCVFGNEEYLCHAVPIYQNILSLLEPADIFFTAYSDVWKNALADLQAETKMFFFEVIEEIFDNSNSFSSILFTEMLKRSFFKFLQAEIENIQGGYKKRVGIVREYPFEFKLGHLKIRGRIDRVDLNSNGYEIIDYKVSQIPKKDKILCILPSEMKQFKSKAVSSIQGAIYALAFGDKVFEINNSSKEPENCFSAFSLYRLKNSNQDDNAILSYSFFNDENKKYGSQQIQIIENELKPYAENILNRNFLPNPLMKEHTCQYCSYQKFCPSFVQNN